MAFLRLKDLLDDGLKGVRLERLQDVALHAELRLLDDPAALGLSGEHDNRDVPGRGVPLQLAHEVAPRALRHVPVADDEVVAWATVDYLDGGLEEYFQYSAFSRLWTEGSLRDLEGQFIVNIHLSIIVFEVS